MPCNPSFTNSVSSAPTSVFESIDLDIAIGPPPQLLRSENVEVEVGRARSYFSDLTDTQFAEEMRTEGSAVLNFIDQYRLVNTIIHDQYRAAVAIEVAGEQGDISDLGSLD